MKTPKPKNNQRKKIALGLIALVVLLFVGATAYAYSTSTWPFQKPTQQTASTNTTSKGVNNVDYSPPSQDDIARSQDAKKRGDTAQTQQPTNNQTQTKKVSVGISFADVVNSTVEIRAFIPNVVEGTGTCTATLTKDGAQSITRQSKAFIDSTTSQCQPIVINTVDFPQTGTWRLVVNYNSPTSEGNSETVEVKL